MSFYIFTIKDMLKSKDNPDGPYGESEIKSILSDFSCPQNKDIEDFIRMKAIEFTKQSIAETYLVYSDYKGKTVLVGFFTLSIKSISVSTKKRGGISKNLIKKLRRFSTNIFNEPIQNEDLLCIPSILIGQLSKNFKNDYCKLISGDELLHLALMQIKKAQNIVGGKICYLECEDKDCLINFYKSNGFVVFGKRDLQPDEKGLYSGKHLIQMLKYI